MDPSSGGPCEGVRNSARELEKLGVHNEVVCLDNPASSFLEKDSFVIYALGDSNNPWRYSNKLFPWLLKNIGKFDVVIVHGIWLYHSYAVNKAIKFHKTTFVEKRRIPKFFIMPHGMLDPYFQRAPGRKLKALRNWIYWELIERKVINNADAILFTCEQELLLAREPFRSYQPKSEANIGYGICAPPPYTIQMGDAFQALCPQLINDAYLLFLGRIDNKKGIDILVNAYASVLKKMSSKGVKEQPLPKLVIAGPGLETAYGKKIMKMVSKSPELSYTVLFPGMLSGDAKWGALYGCDAFVLPSHQENFGVAIVEAMACEKPVLISNQVNIWREIKEEGGGIIAADTIKGTSEMLNEWFKLSAMEKQLMGKRAQKIYEKHYSIGSAVNQLLNTISGG